MKVHLSALLALTLLAPAAVAAHAPVRALALRPGEVAELGGSRNTGLESLRAGKIEAPVALRTQERTGLRAVESQSFDLVDMRAGELTDREWTILAIGAGIVLILILI